MPDDSLLLRRAKRLTAMAGMTEDRKALRRRNKELGEVLAQLSAAELRALSAWEDAQGDEGFPPLPPRTTPGHLAAPKVAPRPTPQPRRIRHVLFDADDTLWDAPGGIATGCKPVETSETDFLRCELGVTGIPLLLAGSKEPLVRPMQLLPGARQVLQELRRRGIRVSMTTINTEKDVLAILEAWKLRPYFAHVYAGWQDSGKARMYSDAALDSRIPPAETVAVDDSYWNIASAERLGMLGLVISPYGDIHRPDEVLRYIL